MNIIPNLLSYPQPQPPSSISLILEPQQKIHPQQFECILVSYINTGMDVNGKILLTDFRCIYMTTKQTLYDENRLVFDIPIGYITKCESSSEMINKVMVFYVDIVSKFGMTIRLKSLKPQFTKLSQIINVSLGSGFRMVQNVEKIESEAQKIKGKEQDSMFCPNYKEFCQNWENLEKWEKSFGQYQDQLAEAYDNEDWTNLPLYPLRFKVPKPFIGKRLTTERVILLSYTYEQHKGKSCALWRSGPGRADTSEDEWVPKASKSTDHLVIEIKNKSIGSNKSIASQLLQLDGPSSLRQSLNKMMLASYYANQGQQQQYKWIVHVNNSRWYEQIQILLSESYLIYDKFTSGINVSILSEWDVRGAQISALIQIISKPEFRTIKGFAFLLQKQFLCFGNYAPGQSKKQKLEEKGVALIQFFDCVYQLMNLYPLSFQFNEDFLTYLALNIYSRKYGNFLYFTKVQAYFTSGSSLVVPTTTFKEEKDRKKKLSEILEKCTNIWAYFHPSQPHYKYYVNPFYVGHKECDVYQFKKKISMKNFKLWGGFFLRDVMIYGQRVQCNHLLKKYRQISMRYLTTKVQTEQLRSKISQQHKLINEKKKQLKQLKKNHLD